MRNNTLQLIALTVCIGVLGCSTADDDSATQSESKPSMGGSTATGASPSAAAEVKPNSNAGAGGTSTQGNSAAQGGISAGRPQATGGAPFGGTTGKGNTLASGGSAATSGTSVATGGVKATGGTGASGGPKATGGTTAAGGAIGTGSTSATGGTTSAPGKKFVGNITTGNSVDTNGMKYAKYWDQLTPENAGKWGSVQSTPTSQFNWAALDSFYAFAQTNSIQFKQHTFVWGAQQPDGTPTLAQVENWIKSYCQRYPNTKLIDVVNEPPPHTTPKYTANLGAGEGGNWPWITKAFKLARQYCPNAVLILNDYNNIEYGDQEQHFIDIVTDIKKNGAPIDAVGCQSHGLHGISAATLKKNLDKMASGTGLPIYITEYDIADASDDAQKSIISAQFPVFWQHTSVKGITFWGWINGKTWVKETGLVNGTAPRPSMTWLMNYLSRPIPPN